MTIGERIKELGFKRWHERTLIEGHIYLVTAFLGMILAFAGMELIGQHGGATRILLGFAASAVGAAILLFCGLRYLRALMLAQNLGERANCPQCGTYAAFNVLSSSRAQTENLHDLSSVWIKVKCRKCANVWTIG